MADQLDLLGSVSVTSPATALAAQPFSPPSANLNGDAMSNMQDSASAKVDGAYKTISEVAEELDVPTHVLRFWESRFPQVKPQRMRGGRRYYRPQDVDVLKKIKTLLYSQGYTIKGAKQHVKEKMKVEMPVMQQAAPVAAAAPAPRVEAAIPKKLPAELSSLLKELKDLKQTLNSFA